MNYQKQKKLGKYLQIDTIHWQDHYKIPFKICHETYLQTFQCRIFQTFFPLQLYPINMQYGTKVIAKSVITVGKQIIWNIISIHALK